MSLTLSSQLQSINQAPQASLSTVQDNPSSRNGLSVTHKISSNVQLPKYDGTFGKAQIFVRDFKEVLEELDYPETEHFGLLLAQCSGHARRTISKQKEIFGKGVNRHLNYFVQYFDNKDKDDSLDDFLSNMRQQHNERSQVLRQRFDAHCSDWISNGQLTSFSQNPTKYKSE